MSLSKQSTPWFAVLTVVLVSGCGAAEGGDEVAKGEFGAEPARVETLGPSTVACAAPHCVSGTYTVDGSGNADTCNTTTYPPVDNGPVIAVITRDPAACDRGCFVTVKAEHDLCTTVRPLAR